MQQNFEQNLNKKEQIQNAENSFTGEQRDVIKAKEMLIAIRHSHEESLSRGEMSAEKFADKMGKINDALLRLDTKSKKFDADFQKSFAEIGSETKSTETSFDKEGGEMIGFDPDVAVESEDRVDGVVSEDEKVQDKFVEDITKVANNEGTSELARNLEKDFSEMNPEERAVKTIENNLAFLAEKEPNQVAQKIQQLTGITLDAGELINSEQNSKNREVLELVSYELFKNFELRVQEPKSETSFSFIVLDKGNMSDVQSKNFDFLKEIALGPGHESSIKNYSETDSDQRVIAYVKERVESTSQDVSANESQQSNNPDNQPIKPKTPNLTESVQMPIDRSIDQELQASEFYNHQTQEISATNSPFMGLGESLTTTSKIDYIEKIQRFDPEIQSRLDTLKSKNFTTENSLSDIVTPMDNTVSEETQNQNISNIKSFDSAKLETTVDIKDEAEQTEKPLTENMPNKPARANNIVNFKRKNQPEIPKPIDLSNGKKDIKPFTRNPNYETLSPAPKPNSTPYSQTNI